MKSILLITAFLLSALVAKAEKKDLLDLPQETRQALLRQAQVFKTNASESIDFARHLTEECGFEYSRDAKGSIKRPHIECTYLPRDPANPFGGMQAKFDCQIETPGKQKFKGKVKYDEKRHPGGGYKEIPQAILGTLITRAMGMEGSLYCPVDLTCINCPGKDPWSNNKSQAAAAEGSRVEFKNVVIEKKMKGLKILQSNPKLPTHPMAFKFPELIANLPEKDTAAAQADREALAIWVNFLGHNDAGAYNMAFTCHGGSVVDGKPSCEKVTASINDYGDGFGLRNSARRMQLSRFESAAGVRSSHNDIVTEGARGTSDPAGLKVSAEGVRRFVEAASRVSDQQLSDILDLAQIETVSDSSKQEWIQTFHSKIQSVREAGH